METNNTNSNPDRITHRMRNSCLGKIQYKNKIAAEMELENIMRKAPNQVFEIYPCEFCNTLHIGHVKGTKPKPKVSSRKGGAEVAGGLSGTSPNKSET